jgi:osmotically-inducible protein OsmY
MATLRLLTPATIALLLLLSRVSGTFSPGRAAAVPYKAPAHRARGALGPRGAAQRAADRVLVRRVRGAIRADPFLTLTAPVVKVSSRRGVVRLVGTVRGDKERSSIAFKVRQIAGLGGIDNRVTIGDGVEVTATAPGRSPRR